MAPVALCLTADPALRRTLRRTLQAAGSDVRFADSLQGVDLGAGAPDLIVLDGQARRALDQGQLQLVGGSRSKVVVVGESLQEDEILSLLKNSTFDHVIEDTGSDDSLVVTSVKLLRQGDIFGLEKYLAWGVLIRDKQVTNYDDKRNALTELAEYAKEAGARRQTVARIEAVADELLMNALYDAPAVREKRSPRIGRGDGNMPKAGDPALVRYASDGRTFAVSVEDRYGELRKEAILENLARARAERGSPRAPAEDGTGGAGLGLFFVLSSVTRFIANVQTGHRTEVICLFDLTLTGRDQDGARSLDVFTT